MLAFPFPWKGKDQREEEYSTLLKILFHPWNILFVFSSELLLLLDDIFSEFYEKTGKKFSLIKNDPLF